MKWERGAHVLKEALEEFSRAEFTHELRRDEAQHVQRGALEATHNEILLGDRVQGARPLSKCLKKLGRRVWGAGDLQKGTETAALDEGFKQVERPLNINAPVADQVAEDLEAANASKALKHQTLKSG